jgi:hypothetical protein
LCRAALAGGRALRSLAVAALPGEASNSVGKDIVDCRIHWTFQNLQNNFFQRRREERNVGSVG